MDSGSRFLTTLCLMYAMLQQSSTCRRAEYKSVSGECCPMCGRGLVVRKDCTEDSSTSCIPCLKGTYMDEPNGYDKCRICTVCDPGHGLHTSRECTTTDNTVCDVLKDYYCVEISSSGCSLAVKHKVCSPGHRIITPGSKSSDTVCEECPEGQYSKHGVNCTAWTDCATIGKQKAEEGSATSDVKCTDFPRHHYILICFVPYLCIVSLCIFLWRRQQTKSNKSSTVRSIQGPVQESAQSQTQASTLSPTSASALSPTPESTQSLTPESSQSITPESTQSVTPEPTQSLSTDSGFASSNIPVESEDDRDKGHGLQEDSPAAQLDAGP